ncbi:MAG: hypothetical protein LBE92_20435 [Chryseobacterium sp.]|jgi:hypothetical protein|uniref:hypothetical protein n=1 Tax=Chryseobacterium sp. TaxID=1871047 RepID=UPI0028283C5E|nr:hypothetical protein [Chryseobacterium sp.]MDR2238503.1 hypothetical protein [Chryseobacterium sp.]
MDKNYMNIIINERRGHLGQLKKLIISMNISPGMDKEFCAYLAERILRQLEKGVDSQKIQEIITYELCVGYGLYVYEFDSEKITDDIMDWWENL